MISGSASSAYDLVGSMEAVYGISELGARETRRMPALARTPIKIICFPKCSRWAVNVPVVAELGVERGQAVLDPQPKFSGCSGLRI